MNTIIFIINIIIFIITSPCFPVTEQSVQHIAGAQQMFAKHKLNALLHILDH